MISEFFLSLGAGIVGWFFDLFPDTSGAEDFVVTAGNHLGALASGMAALGAWMPWAALTACMGVIITLYVLLFFVKAARNLFSHVPVIGGNG